MPEGHFHFMSIGFHASVLPCDATSFVHSDNIYGNPASLSDARLKKEITPISGEQALSVLNNIKASTYKREDLDNEKRLGLIADEVESAIEPLEIENVVGNKFYQNEEYKTLDYSRLVSLLIPAVNALSARVSELEAKLPKSRKNKRVNQKKYV